MRPWQIDTGPMYWNNLREYVEVEKCFNSLSAHARTQSIPSIPADINHTTKTSDHYETYTISCIVCAKFTQIIATKVLNFILNIAKTTKRREEERKKWANIARTTFDGRKIYPILCTGRLTRTHLFVMCNISINNLSVRRVVWFSQIVEQLNRC